MSVHRRHRSLISLLLLVLVARALVPVGFMPAADGTAGLTLCPAGMLMPADAGMSDRGAPASGHLHTDSCPFGSAPFAAPLATLPVIPARTPALLSVAPEPAARVLSGRPTRTHQPRGPPSSSLA